MVPRLGLHWGDWSSGNTLTKELIIQLENTVKEEEGNVGWYMII